MQRRLPDPGGLFTAPLTQVRPLPLRHGSSIATPTMQSRAAAAASSRADNDSFLRNYLAGLRK